MGEAGQLGKEVVTTFLRGKRHNRALLVPNPVYAWDEGVKHIKSTAVKWARAWGAGFSTYLEDTQGRLWVCGLNNYGQLGVGDQDNRMRPVLMSHPRGEPASPLHSRVAGVAGGQHCALVLTSEGALYAMGRGDSGQLALSADGITKPKFAAASFLPQRIPQQRFGGAAVVQVAGAGAFSLALSADGKVWAWGYGDMGQLGNGQDEDEILPFNVTAACAGLKGGQSLQVAAGDQHSVLLAVPGAASAGGASGGSAPKRARKQ
jgi:regulator of chromosome condensation